ncbi:MAG TPA: ABC transporter ATP-binding protein [Anaerolineae bacterium]|nr:ABC transporter ATP-binding protein [Anaerolineae bacterium]
MLTKDGIEVVPVHIQNVTKRFGDIVAVDNLTLEIERGKLTTLLGPSGCGKTTTLRILAGFYIPEEGVVTVGDEEVTHMPPFKRPTVTVFQSYALFPHMSVGENVAFGLKLRSLTKAEVSERVEMALLMVGLGGLADRSPGQLSGGQQQRVALARALVLQPKVLLLDEPLSNLDAKLRVQMRDEIRRLQQRLGITTVYVTHDQAEAMSISDKIAVMNKGKLQQVGSPQSIYLRPKNTFVADFIGQANFIKSAVIAKNAQSLTVRLFNQQASLDSTLFAEFEQGDAVNILVRPEAVTLSAETSNISGLVTRSTYLGAQVEYEVEVGDQLIIALDNEPYRHQVFAEGDHVQVHFDIANFHLLRPEN